MAETPKEGEAAGVVGGNALHVAEEIPMETRHLVVESQTSNPTTNGAALFAQLNLFAEAIRTPHDELVDVVDKDGDETTLAPISSPTQQGETMRGVSRPEVIDVATYVNAYAAGG